MICVGCGCSDSQACVDRHTLERCHWVDGDGEHGVCSFCAEGLDALVLDDVNQVELMPPLVGLRVPLYQPIAFLEFP